MGRHVRNGRPRKLVATAENRTIWNATLTSDSVLAQCVLWTNCVSAPPGAASFHRSGSRRQHRLKGRRENSHEQGRPMKTIDTHAHILTEQAIHLMAKEAPKIGPRLTPIDRDSAVIDVDGVSYRPFPHGAWDLEQRFKDMDTAEVDMQIVSNTPQTFLYNQDGSLNAALA